MVDIADRIDNIITESTSFKLTFLYFLYKVPNHTVLSLPISVLLGTLLTFSVMSRTNELVVMRASGVPLKFLMKSVWVVGGVAVAVFILMSEFVVPPLSLKAKKIYNIDIKKKIQRGVYSKEEIWWREKGIFYSVNFFDAKSEQLKGVNKFKVGPDFLVQQRLIGETAKWAGPGLGWSLKNVKEYVFKEKGEITVSSYPTLALKISLTPRDFYNAKRDPASFSFREYKEYIKKQRENGLPTAELYPDLWDKLALPFVCLIIPFFCTPFAISHKREHHFTKTFITGAVVSFAYYVIHSFSLALGRAEFIPAFLSAWSANLFFLLIGIIIAIDAETPH
ncbi:MAG: LptF/LptG family permease [Candidatus Dadabacteria bacterium]|nr:MAG: LptF/LptG family permease [Candidatus Dadabacteria bacterium]